MSITQVGDYELVGTVPSVDDYIRLRHIGGLSPFPVEAVRQGLKGTVFAVSVRQGTEAVGMGRIIGDGGCFFQIVDIVVDPDHQGRGLGKAIMTALTDHIRTHIPASAYVSLIADLPADKLYEGFGFVPTAPRSIGMALARNQATSP